MVDSSNSSAVGVSILGVELLRDSRRTFVEGVGREERVRSSAMAGVAVLLAAEGCSGVSTVATAYLLLSQMSSLSTCFSIVSFLRSSLSLSDTSQMVKKLAAFTGVFNISTGSTGSAGATDEIFSGSCSCVALPSSTSDAIEVDTLDTVVAALAVDFADEEGVLEGNILVMSALLLDRRVILLARAAATGSSIELGAEKEVLTLDADSEEWSDAEAWEPVTAIDTGRREGGFSALLVASELLDVVELLVPVRNTLLILLVIAMERGRRVDGFCSEGKSASELAEADTGAAETAALVAGSAGLLLCVTECRDTVLLEVLAVEVARLEVLLTAIDTGLLACLSSAEGEPLTSFS